MPPKKERALVIVESPAKARTIGAFLGSGYTVEASVGHIRDLPSSAKDLPESIKQEPWARLGVNVYENFEPVYVVPTDKKRQIQKLRNELKQATALYLATDEDREGESISWHLYEVLRPMVPVHRLVFHEITKTAIEEALANPRKIDQDLVQAQEARRILDRLYGYEVSPLLWYKIQPKLSAGRVQSVAVRLIVERERERCAFRNATYWDLLGKFRAGQRSVEAVLVSVGELRIPTGRDFDSATGKPTGSNLLILNEDAANSLASRLQKHSVTSPATVAAVEAKPYTTKPYPPFTTSTLQQEANRKLGLSSRTTMSLAQNLYENGYITYMRTDSTTLSQEALKAARSHVEREYGREYLPDSPRVYATKVKNAQEAHEAIRPAGSTFATPESLRGKVSPEALRLYELIWKRTVASQMVDARGQRTSITIAVDDARFTVSGKTIEFAGYLRAYVEGSDDPDAELADREVVLPKVAVGEAIACEELLPKSHTTKPPARYSEASLTRVMTEKGIGRPSTYASIIETIVARNYVFKKDSALVPTWVGIAVCQLLEDHLPDLVNYDFTAQMEDQLDAISRGELGHVGYLRQFYFGEGGSPGEETESGLKFQLDNKRQSIDAREVNQIYVGAGEDEIPIHVRIGKFGAFLQHGMRRASLPDNIPPDELTVEVALRYLEQSERGDEPLGICETTQQPVYLKNGRFGPYVQRGTAGDGVKPQNASLLKGMTPEMVTLEVALALLSLPRLLGKTTSGDDVFASNGPYGPYVKSGSDTRSLPEGVSPLEVTLEEAIHILAQPKTHGRRTAGGAAAPPVREFGESPVTGKSVRVMNGRFGMYITDGVTNVTLPRGSTPDELTQELALDMLAIKAAAGPSPRRGGARGGTRRGAKTATPKTAAKKVPAKKAATKKATPKKASAKKAATKKTPAKKK
ncbi:MAG: type I DNA topoisomerase [Thermoguttaceae bacterium]